MLTFTSIVGYTSCGPTYIEIFLFIFGQCINVLNYNIDYNSTLTLIHCPNMVKELSMYVGPHDVKR